MAFNSKDFIAEVLKDSKLDETKKAVLLEVASDPSVSKRFQDLHEGSLRQSEFSKKMDELNKTKKGVQDYWSGLVEWKKTEEQRFEEELKRLKQRSPSPYGDEEELDHNQNLRFNADDLKKEYDQRFQQLEQNSIAYNNKLVSLGLQHYKNYGEILDPDKLVEVARENGMNIVAAYEHYTQPLRDEKVKNEYLKQIDDLQKQADVEKEKARREGADEALRNRGLPSADGQFGSGVPHALDKLDVPPEKSEGKYGWKAAVGQFSEDRRTGKTLPTVL